MEEKEKKFSFLFSEIVENENDMIGHIAYSLYKSSKIQFIENLKEENGGTPPTEDQLDTFHKVSKANIQGFRIQAEIILSNFTELTLQESISEIEQATLNNQHKILSDIIEPIKPAPPKGPWDGFMMAVLVKGTQTLVVAVVLFLIIFGSSAIDDFWGTVRNWIPEGHQQENLQKTDSVKSNNSHHR